MLQQRSGSTPMGELERKLEELPLLPAIVSEVLALDVNSDLYFDRLLQLAQRDPPFAVSVLRCANSASSAPLSAIVTLEQAVTRLGTQRCAGLILALAVIKVFVPRTTAQRFLWIHSLQTALLARMFCQRIPAVRSNPGQAYLCGLLHDIGRFVQFEGAPADLARVDDMHWASPQELIDAERSTLGYDHSLLGWHACHKWSLPATIGEVVRRHHEVLPEGGKESDELVRVVQWADKLSTALIVNPAMAQCADDALTALLASDYADIGPATVPGERPAWHRFVPDVRTESLHLAGQLHLL